MGRNYRFLLYGARPELAGLLAELADLADPPQAGSVLLELGPGEIIGFKVDAAADKNETNLDLTTLGSSAQVLTWLRFKVSDPKDPALEFIRNHWADDNRELLPQNRVRFGVGIEITLSDRFYELALSSATSSGSAIFSFSSAVRSRIQALMPHALFGLFDSEQAAYKLLPHHPGADWGSLDLSFEEEDMILYSDRAGNLNACVEMLQKKIEALPDSKLYLAAGASEHP